MWKVAIAVVVVLAVSVALTIHSEGVDRAYGGFFARFAAGDEAVPGQPSAGPAQSRHPSTTAGASVEVSGTDYRKVTDRIRGRLGAERP